VQSGWKPGYGLRIYATGEFVHNIVNEGYQIEAAADFPAWILASFCAPLFWPYWDIFLYIVVLSFPYTMFTGYLS
jgi:hypothetical protein